MESPLYRWRSSRSMTQVELGAAAGMRQGVISQAESGAARIPPAVLSVVVEADGCEAAAAMEAEQEEYMAEARQVALRKAVRADG